MNNGFKDHLTKKLDKIKDIITTTFGKASE